MKLEKIDNGKEFDWGKTSKDYAKFRDVYPEVFYKKIIELGVGIKGQTVLDVGTGTGVLPRNLYNYGAEWYASDIAENQIINGKELAEKEGMKINFFTSPAEQISFPEGTFDAITACQCIWYPDANVCSPNFCKMLKSKGKFLVLYMGWLPLEDRITKQSEEIVLKYNPDWKGAWEAEKETYVPGPYFYNFDVIKRENFRVSIPFTRETWHGRMRASRGVGASMNEETLAAWEKEHMEMLMHEPESFEIQHYISYALMEKKW